MMLFEISLLLLNHIFGSYIVAANQIDQVSYKGHQLFKVHPQSQEDVNLLKEIQKKDDPEMHFWTEPSTSGKAVHIMVTPEKNKELHLALKTAKASYDISIPDIQSAIDAQRDNITNSGNEQFNFYSYFPLEKIMAWLDQLAAEKSHLMKLIDIGLSHEGRPIKVVKISSSNSDSSPRAAIWMDAGIHANEWVTPATLLYVIQKLVTGYDVVREVTWLMKNLDFYILPVFNVDGYVYSWEKDRLWRKNTARYNQTDGACIGVDLNRNWPFKWGEGDSEHDPCGRMYIGPSPQSEPEVRAVINFLAHHNESIISYLAFHSFGQLWMTPFSSKGNGESRNIEELIKLSEVITKAIYEVHGTKFNFGSISNLVGEASGASVDYTYSVLDIPYSFGIELRDTGTYGTLLPPEQILPTAEEAFTGIETLAMILIDKFYDYNYYDEPKN